MMRVRGRREGRYVPDIQVGSVIWVQNWRTRGLSRVGSGTPWERTKVESMKHKRHETPYIVKVACSDAASGYTEVHCNRQQLRTIEELDTFWEEAKGEEEQQRRDGEAMVVDLVSQVGESSGGDGEQGESRHEYNKDSSNSSSSSSSGEDNNRRERSSSSSRNEDSGYGRYQDSNNGDKGAWSNSEQDDDHMDDTEEVGEGAEVVMGEEADRPQEDRGGDTGRKRKAGEDMDRSGDEAAEQAERAERQKVGDRHGKACRKRHKTKHRQQGIKRKRQQDGEAEKAKREAEETGNHVSNMRHPL
jgi:hypothetical protein